MLPLMTANVGDTVTIGKITGKDEVRQHLAELGFVVGTEVTIISAPDGNLIVSVKDSRVGIDRAMASRILYTV